MDLRVHLQSINPDAWLLLLSVHQQVPIRTIAHRCAYYETTHLLRDNDLVKHRHHSLHKIISSEEESIHHIANV